MSLKINLVQISTYYITQIGYKKKTRMKISFRFFFPIFHTSKHMSAHVVDLSLNYDMNMSFRYYYTYERDSFLYELTRDKSFSHRFSKILKIFE